MSPETENVAPLNSDHADARVCTADPIRAALAAAGLAQPLPLQQALVDYPELDRLRQPLIAEFGGRAAMLSCSGLLLAPLLPRRLQACPVWYIRLPEAWRDEVPGFAVGMGLDAYLCRSHDDPWYIGQWLIVSGPSRSWDDTPRLEILDDDVRGSLQEGFHTGGVIAIFECAGLLTFVAYPIDELFIACLSAGDTASSRHPLFDLTLGELQAHTRELEDGRAPVPPATILTLPVRGLLTEEQSRQHQEQQAALQRMRDGTCRDEPGPGRPFVRYAMAEQAAVGLLPTILNYLPSEFDHGARTWLRITVTDDVFAQLGAALPSMEVIRLPAENEGRDDYVVRALVGNTWIVAVLSPGRPGLWEALDAFCAMGRCDVAFENKRNGRIVAAELQWPVAYSSQRGGSAWVDDENWYGEYYSAVDAMAEATARAVRRTVDLQVSTVIGASQWQREDLQEGADGPGRAGGLLRIVE
jgi:hypothetical protein